ncbi:hypothetical protein R1flu_028724 [Riccia fluitans]|uniref:Uncharacterized protein n=1 Tax=Riccia fluitans TaxID=41844 RepID=A0ABD1XQH4_9MARC
MQSAWPEYQGQNLYDVQKQLEANGVKAFISDGTTPLPNSGTDGDDSVWLDDVWLYPGIDDQSWNSGPWTSAC